ncbi:DUF427 domain-containing protein [Streptomyces aidingensis]|uniref:Uncharacterized conserved protein, DUF427 family n=1 Tax=Streptomyces aidingensis TaxID=910347 RepID=A0A1I1SL24_9ACTN|nr:DUF427 domain-containing protein [Streptomyces aidingensis]SFD47111.1 Uncharacterized conserved protein, DUF427 family [Streptomyces aidingensis]
MSLTKDGGPLSASPVDTVNYDLSGPAHRLFFQRFPRRVRAVLGGETVADTREGRLLHETGLLPQLYIPAGDVRPGLLEAAAHTTHCPFKGQAVYWHIRAGNRRVENGVWAYPEPIEGAGWLRGHLALYWHAADAWFDEDEQVHGHLRDPYHRVDVRRTSGRLRVLVEGVPVAETDRPMLLTETGLPNRYYVPAGDVRQSLLAASPKRTVCPYKGTASYWSFTADGRQVADVAWSYPRPLEEATRVGGHLCFAHRSVTTELDGHPVAAPPPP